MTTCKYCRAEIHRTYTGQWIEPWENSVICESGEIAEGWEHRPEN